MVEMDMTLELEDDVFYADLSKRIALLIMDDDKEEEAFPLQYPSVSLQLQAFSHTSQLPMAASPFLYEEACRREMRGTGVFIPRSSLPRRKHRTGRPRHSDKAKSAAVSAAPNMPIGGGPLPTTAATTTTTTTTTNGISNSSQKPFNCSRKSQGLKKHLL